MEAFREPRDRAEGDPHGLSVVKQRSRQRDHQQERWEGQAGSGLWGAQVRSPFPQPGLDRRLGDWKS